MDDRTPTRSRHHLVESPAQAALARAVAPSECEGTLLDTYIDQLFADMTDEQFAFLVAHQDTLFNVPTYDALFFGTPNDPDYALESHAQQIRNTFRDLRRFWNIESADIQLMAMHGDVLLDADRIAKTLTAMVATGELDPMTPAEIRAEATTVAHSCKPRATSTTTRSGRSTRSPSPATDKPTPSSRRSQTSSSWAMASSTPTTPLASVTWGSA